MSAPELHHEKGHYKDLTVGDLMTRLAADFPENQALVYPSRNLRYSFKDLNWMAREIARGLMSLGIARGDRVAIWAPNVPEWVVLQFALAKIGAILVTANTSLRSNEIEYLLKQSEACTLILYKGVRDVDYVETIYEIAPELRRSEPGYLKSYKLPALRNVIYIGDETPDGMIRYDSLLNRAEFVREADLDRRSAEVAVDDVINMQYTSGTTGFPKGVMLTSRNIVNNGYWLGKNLGFTSRDKLCVPVPFFHCFGCVIGVLGAYSHAASIVPLEWFDPLKVLQFVEQERCTALYGVPTMFLAELEQLDFHTFDLASLRTGIMAGALCPEPLMRKVIDRMNLREMTIAYGLTEASPGVTVTSPDDTIEMRTQTVGRVLPEVEVKIVEPFTGEECAPGAEGELCCRGYNVMKGYFRNQRATDEAIDKDNWLHTGDQATIDGRGYVRITGRIKELIIRGGENIAPKEVEDLLRQNPKVADVYVYGVPDEKYGETVAAAIRLNPGETSSAEEIAAFCDDKIARFKIPRYIVFMDSFPLTASGKVQRFKLREEFVRQHPPS